MLASAIYNVYTTISIELVDCVCASVPPQTKKRIEHYFNNWHDSIEPIQMGQYGTIATAAHVPTAVFGCVFFSFSVGLAQPKNDWIEWNELKLNTELKFISFYFWNKWLDFGRMNIWIYLEYIM